MTAEFFKDMPIEEYHSKKDFISKSMLSEFADCPARFKFHFIDNYPKPESKSLRMGSAVHTLALEPETWKGNYHIMPTTYFDDKGVEKAWRNDKRMKVYQDQMQAAGYNININDDKEMEFEARTDSKIILTKDEYDSVEQMAESLTKNAYAFSLLKSPGYVESSIFYDYMTEDGELIQCRTRPDLNRNDGLLVDLKTAASVKPEFFFKSAFDLHYDLSVAMSFHGYNELHGKPPEDYAFIGVENTAPFLVECWESTTPMTELNGMSYLEYGLAHFKHLMERYAQCRAANNWPGYQERIGSMKIPGWAMKNFMLNGFKG